MKIRNISYLLVFRSRLLSLLDDVITV